MMRLDEEVHTAQMVGITAAIKDYEGSQAT